MSLDMDLRISGVGNIDVRLTKPVQFVTARPPTFHSAVITEVRHVSI